MLKVVHIPESVQRGLKKRPQVLGNAQQGRGCNMSFIAFVFIVFFFWWIFKCLQNFIAFLAEYGPKDLRPHHSNTDPPSGYTFTETNLANSNQFNGYCSDDDFHIGSSFEDDDMVRGLYDPTSIYYTTMHDD